MLKSQNINQKRENTKFVIREAKMEIKVERKKVIFKIKRYNPETQESRYESYEIDVPKGMTILEGLQYIKDNIDATLSFRAFCRSAICGSCAVRINGYPKLACKTQIWNETSIHKKDELTIEPIDNMKVIKDLIVDWDEALNRLKEMKTYLIPDENVVPKSLDKESLISPSEEKKYDKFTDCILCTSCFSACTAIKLNERYGGPFALARLYRFSVDSRDKLKKQRAKTGYENLFWMCVRCNKCQDVCPKHIPNVEGIMKLRGFSIEIGLKDNPGAKHVKAFQKSLKESGLLNEMLLPLRTKGVKGLIENIPMGINMLKKGKIHSPIMKPIKEHNTLLEVMKESMEAE
jgi:succinate dehydrogenase / fumarate reductase iron-sulfur subunit